MATHPQSSVSERPELTVQSGRRGRTRPATSMKTRLVSTAIALIVLALMLRYLPAGNKNAQAKTPTTTAAGVQATPADLRLASVQMSETVGGEALYLDGRVTNDGGARITGATAQVTFSDIHGQQVASLQKPVVGMSQGGVGVVRNEFSNNPIRPKETRFFRIAIDQIPPTWNHEVPELKIIEVKSK